MWMVTTYNTKTDTTENIRVKDSDRAKVAKDLKAKGILVVGLSPIPAGL